MRKQAVWEKISDISSYAGKIYLYIDSRFPRFSAFIEDITEDLTIKSVLILPFLLLFLVSTFNMFLGFGSWGVLEIDQDTYADRFGSFEPVLPNFYEERLSNFQQFGPRSELLMSLTDRYKGLDFTYNSPYGPHSFEIFSTGSTGVVLSLQLIPIVLAGTILVAVVWKEDRMLRWLGVGSLVLLLLFSVNISDTYVQGEAFTDEQGWKAVNSSLSFVSHSQGNSALYLDVRKNSPVDRKEIDVFVNGRKLNSYNLTGKKEIYVPAVEGRNEVKIKSESCEIPKLYENNSKDIRCLSFSVNSVSQNSTEDFEKPVLRGFYGDNIESSPWLEDNPRIIATAQQKDSVPVIKFDKLPYIQDSDLLLKINGERVRRIENSDFGKKLYLNSSEVREGVNYIELESGKCEVPAEQNESSQDNRCLNYRLQSFSMQSESEIPQFIFRDGWYSEDSQGRWMSNESDLKVKLDKDKSMISLDLEPYKGLKNSHAEIIVNGDPVKNISINGRRQVLVPVKGREGLNDLTIRTRNGCRVPARDESSDDDRCLSMFLHNIDAFTVVDQQTLFQKGWYDSEKTGQGSYRWMSNSSYLVYNSTGGEILTLSGLEYDRLDNSSLRIYTDGRKIADIDSDDFEKKQVHIDTDPGITTLRFESSEGCIVPAETEEESKDTRCLSYRFDFLELDEESFGQNWYSREGDSDFSYRWMSERAGIKFPADERREQIELEFKPYRYLSNPVLEVYLNGERKGMFDLENSGRINRVLEVQTEDGVNNLTFESRNGCESPSDHEKLSNDIRCLSFQFSSIDIE
jgi:hypothetical protein